MTSKRFGTRLRSATTWLATFLFFGCFSAAVFGQQDSTATIIGQVKDASGAAVGGATVKAVSKATGAERTIQTTEDGNYILTPLVAGDYTLTVERSGFKKSIIEALTLSVADRRLLNITLETGDVTDAVEVTAIPTVIQDSPTTQTLTNGDQVRELPLNNRNFLKLLEITPGVSSALEDEETNGDIGFGLTSRTSVSINGMRRNSVNYLVDGVTNSDVGSNITLLSTPTIDSVQEFKIQTANYTAEFGRSAGGVVSLVTKGGTKDFHGSVYEFVRNDYFNANTFFNNRAGRRADGSLVAPVPVLRYNNFGGTIGGPIFFPGYARDKTFFFFSYEGRRIIRASSTSSIVVPTARQRTGDFSATLGAVIAGGPNVTDTNGASIPLRVGQIFRPDGIAYAGNIIPQGDLSPQARALLNAYPSANGGQDANSSTFNRTNTLDTDQFVIRIDHVFNSNHRIFGRYTRDESRTLEASGLFNSILLPNVATTRTSVPGNVFAATYTAIINPRLVNELTSNFSSNTIGSNLVGRGRKSDYPGAEAIPEVFTENFNNAIPNVNIAGLAGIGSTQGFQIEYRNLTFRDNLTWIIGNHTLKFGAELTFEQKNENGSNNTQGTYAFSNVATQAGSAVAANFRTQTGNAVASFLLGRANTYSEAERDIKVNFRFGRREFFAQDTWKFRPNLTFDFGVRYQYYVPVVDKDNVLTNFVVANFRQAGIPTCATANCAAFLRGTGDPLNGIVVAGTNSPFNRRVTPRDTNNFSPRVGIAWDPFKDGKTVIRAGYGFYYDQLLVGFIEQNSFVNPPFVNTASFSSPTVNGPTGFVTFAAPSGGAAPNTFGAPGLIANASDLETPTIQQWSLGVQRELFKGAAIDVAYVGTKGDNLLRQYNINFPQVAAVAGLTTGQNVNLVRPFRGYGNINWRETSARSRYHGLLSSFIYNIGQSGRVTLAYTWSKTLTDATNDRDAIDEPQNPQNLIVEYAEARSSRPHVFSASYVYELPFFKKDSRLWARLLLSGYQISGLTTIASGRPQARILLGDTLGGARGNRPNFISDPTGGLTGTRDANGLEYFFDPNSVAAPANGTYGNSSRAFARRPSTNITNLTLTKMFRFGPESRFNLQLRAEMYNVFNHTVFTAFGTTFIPGSADNGPNGTFGRPTGSLAPREFQFAARFSF